MTPLPHPNTRRPPSPARGFSIAELLVALAVGMVLTVAITLIMMRHDATRRAITSTNDAQLNANYLGYVLDRALRSAGTGFAQGWRVNYGCRLHVARGGAQLLPRAGNFPAPFAAVGPSPRLAPVLIHAGAGAGGSDVLAVASGASGLGEVASRVVAGTATNSSLNIPTTVGIRGNDLVLVAEAGLGCMVQQLTGGFAGGVSQQLNFGGTYSTASIAGLPLNGYSGMASVSLLGNPAGSPPMFQLIGLGDNLTLFSYDLLRLDGTDTPRPMANGVVTMHARYGVDSDGDGQMDTWVAPTDANYTAATLQDGSDAARDRLLGIMAVRLSLVLRSDRIEREDVSPAALTLFEDLPSSVRVTRSLSSEERRIRHRVMELTVPLRNSIHQAR
jgi:type IV pilus assembly protein PilW